MCGWCSSSSSPGTFFKGVLAFIFTFVIPLALMTTFPAEAMLGSMVFAFIARRVWLRSIGHYTSASS
jgi:ABC-2 type transport system permease protein